MNSDTKDSSLVLISNKKEVDSYFVYVAPKGMIFEGRYRFPGGKLKLGEEYSATLIRELQEEYAVELACVDLLHTKPNVLGEPCTCAQEKSEESLCVMNRMLETQNGNLQKNSFSQIWCQIVKLLFMPT